MQGFPVEDGRRRAKAPGYEIGSMSIIKGARNLANAKKFYDWALTPEAQQLGAAGQAVPDAVEQGDAAAAARRPSSPKIKLINYDYAKYGAVGRAQAPDRALGEGSQLAAALSDAVSAASSR